MSDDVERVRNFIARARPVRDERLENVGSLGGVRRRRRNLAILPALAVLLVLASIAVFATLRDAPPPGSTDMAARMGAQQLRVTPAETATRTPTKQGRGATPVVGRHPEELTATPGDAAGDGGVVPASGGAAPVIAADRVDLVLSVDCSANPQSIRVANRGKGPFVVRQITGWIQDSVLRHGPFRRRDIVSPGRAVTYFSGSRAPDGPTTLSRELILERGEDLTTLRVIVGRRGKYALASLDCGPGAVSSSWGFNPHGGLDPYLGEDVERGDGPPAYSEPLGRIPWERGPDLVISVECYRVPEVVAISAPSRRYPILVNRISSLTDSRGDESFRISGGLWTRESVREHNEDSGVAMWYYFGPKTHTDSSLSDRLIFDDGAKGEGVRVAFATERRTYIAEVGCKEQPGRFVYSADGRLRKLSGR
jgi:hypothetical protein